MATRRDPRKCPPDNGDVIYARWTDGTSGLAYRNGGLWFRMNKPGKTWDLCEPPKTWQDVEDAHHEIGQSRTVSRVAGALMATAGMGWVVLSCVHAMNGQGIRAIATPGFALGALVMLAGVCLWRPHGFRDKGVR